MPPIQPPLINGVLEIDNTALEQFSTCRRQAQYYLVRKVESNKSKIALDFGAAFHKVLEYAYKKFGPSYRSNNDNADIIRYAQSLPPWQDVNGEDYRNLPYLVQAVSNYLQSYPAEPFTFATLPSGQVGIEVPFIFPLAKVESSVFGTIPVMWKGVIDVLYRRDGVLGVLDHKTTSMMGPQFMAEFEISHQFYGYVAAAEYITGETVSEITVNGIGCRKPTVKGTGKTFENHRGMIAVNRSLIAEWHQDTLALVTDFISCCEAGYFPKQTKWCVGKYGACQYRALCTLPPEHRESAINTSEFRPVVWDPLKKGDAA